MKRYTVSLIVLVALLVSAPISAQSLPAPACDTLKQLGAKFGTLNKGDDDARRQFALIVAQQFAFSFPGDGWGSKAAGAGRPQTKDVVARLRSGVLDGWDLVNGSTREVVCTSHADLPGQLFIAVTPVNHLGAVTPPPPDPPVVDPPAPSTGAATAELQQQQLALLLQIVSKLEAQQQAQQEQSAKLEAAIRDLKAEIAKGIKVRF